MVKASSHDENETVRRQRMRIARIETVSYLKSKDTNRWQSDATCSQSSSTSSLAPMFVHNRPSRVNNWPEAPVIMIVLESLCLLEPSRPLRTSPGIQTFGQQ